jgi:S1-C subfamily serine protease
MLLLLGSARMAAGQSAERVKSGTGFFVSDDGFLVTSAHVVSGCPLLTVWNAGGTERPAHLIAADRRRDIALLWVDGAGSRLPATFAPLPPHAGDPVFTLGCGVVADEPLHPVLAQGTLLGSGTARSGNRVLTIRARLRAGTSGGPVLANDGSLVGMVIGRDEHDPNLGVAVPDDEIAGLLSHYGIALVPRHGAANAANRLIAISVLVQCAS